MNRHLVAALALGLAACSGGDGEPGAASSTAETTLSRPSTTVRATTTTTTRPPERLTSEARLRMDGIGPIRVGMTVDQASAAAGVPIRVGDDEFGNCRYAWVPAFEGLDIFVIDGRIARVGVGDGPIRTVSGIGIGATEAEVHRVYGSRITVERHIYAPTGHYLVYTAADPSLQQFSLLFETDGRVVTTFRSGLKGAVARPEGCV